MTVRVGINGFGRIGRSFYRAILARGAGAGVELVAVNDPFGDSETMAFLLKHDSVGGVLPNEVKVSDGGFSVDGNEVRKLESKDPAEIPWGDHGVDVVIESTGIFTARDKAAGHIAGGAKRVIISAPSGDADAMICMGVNDEVFDPAQHTVISNASCTTNCLAPMAKVLNDRFGIEQGLITTVHAYTSDQQLQDMATVSRSGQARPAPHAGRRPVDHPQLDRRRPGHRHGAARAQGPPRRDVAAGARPHRVDHRPGGHRRSRRPPRKRSTPPSPRPPAPPPTGACCSTPRRRWCRPTSSRNPASCIFSAPDTMVSGRMVKILGWYDNEWGYSNRLVDLAAFIAK